MNMFSKNQINSISLFFLLYFFYLLFISPCFSDFLKEFGFHSNNSISSMFIVFSVYLLLCIWVLCCYSILLFPAFQGNWFLNSDAFMQCTTNDETFRGEIFGHYVVIHALLRDQALHWQIFHKGRGGFVNNEAFKQGIRMMQKHKDDFHYFNPLFKVFK